MKNRVWELSMEDRRKPQKGKLREMLIGTYAPREPEVMDFVLVFKK